MEQGAVGLLALVVLVVALAAWAWRYDRTLRGPDPPGAAGRRHTWRPRTPEDCPACRAASVAPACDAAPGPRAWAEVKGRRGAPKRVVTEGYACPAAHCPYYGITDGRLHALVGYGHHGTTDRIQAFRCQACGTRVSARRGTALYRLKTPPARVGEGFRWVVRWWPDRSKVVCVRFTLSSRDMDEGWSTCQPARWRLYAEPA